MARSRIRQLLIPRKTQKPVDQPGYGVDARTIEIWAKQVLDYLNNNGIIEITSTGATITITDPFGPVTNIEAVGGGGGGITDLVSPAASITITHPTGPTTDVDLAGIPFLNTGNYSDADSSTAYGHNALSAGGPGGSGTDTTAVGAGALGSNTGNNNTAVGAGAGGSITTGVDNVAIGAGSLAALTTNSHNIAIGAPALQVATAGGNIGIGFNAFTNLTTGGGAPGNVAVGNSSGGGIVTGVGNTAIGSQALSGSSTDVSYGTAIGYNTVIVNSGCVAIGVDHTGASAVGSHQDDFVLGTNLHVIQMLNNTTGAGTALLGANSPAITNTAPYTWVKVRVADGSICYLPVWK